MNQHTRMVAIAALMATCTSALAQGNTRDVDVLVELEQAVAMAADRIAPALVRIETFGGVRRVLTGESGHDRIGGIQPSKLDGAVLKALLDRIDRYELAELWTQLGLPPKATDAEFEFEDLRQLGDQELDRLCRKYQVGKYDPEKQKEEDEKKGLGPLVQPGFLQAQGASTGIVISRDGWILTSRFALNFDPSTILVSFPDGRTMTARRAGEDTSRGIALLKVEADDLEAVEFAPTTEVAVGRWVFVLGRTFAATGRPSVHLGIVSALGRIFGRALQTDAWTSPANYGGPVVDVQGRVLGIAVPLSPSGRDAGVDWHDSGIGFTTTIAEIAPLLDRMKLGETLHRAWLGIAVDPKLLGPGASIVNLVPRSPASGLGWLRGDLVTHVDGVAVRNSFHLQILIGSRMAGDEVEIRTARGEVTQTFAVRLGALPAAEREERTRSEETSELPWNGDPKPEDGSGR